MDDPAPDVPAFAALFDALYGDERRCDDRTMFTECAWCGRAIRWVSNLGSRRAGNIQIVARPVTTGACFDAREHVGLVAVGRGRVGFTVSRFTTRDELDDTILYACHWDVCEQAERVRDRMHRERYGAHEHERGSTDLAALHRYHAWRNER